MSERKRIGLREVRALGLGEIVWDGAVVGFGARRQKGKAVTYFVKYRVLGGAQHWYSIGRHGALTPDQARSEARRILGNVAKGEDPAADRAAGRSATTIAELAAVFLAEHVELKRKPRTAQEYRRRLEHVILPMLGRKRVTELTRQDVRKFHHDRRATPIEANHSVALLSTLMNFAEQSGMRPDGSNPCRHVERFPQRPRERFLSAEELARLGEAIAGYRGSSYVPAAIKLLVFTGARLGEVLGLRWEWIDFERGEARLPDSKSGPKTVHLPPPALGVLQELPRVEGNPHVIVGGKEGAALANLEKPWRAVRAAAGLEDVRLHDLRHAFASVAASSGMGLPIIGKMLGHAQPATTARYAHLASDPVKAAAAAVAGQIEAAMSAGGKPDPVVRLRGQPRRNAGL
jgi:integrase